jgi:hypothetical protein
MCSDSTLGRAWFCLIVSGSMFAGLPSTASAASVTINDLTTPVTILVDSSVEQSTLSTQSGPESADAHFAYNDNIPLTNGTSVTLNFNIIGPNETLSDTLNIVLTGITPDPALNFINTVVDVHFLSDTGNLLPLANAITLTETGSFQDVSPFIAQASQLSNLSITFASDLSDPSAVVTPVPAALPLFATGLGALGLLGWRRKRKPAT